MHFHKKWPLRQYCKFIDRTPVGVSKPSKYIRQCNYSCIGVNRRPHVAHHAPPPNLADLPTPMNLTPSQLMIL